MTVTLYPHQQQAVSETIRYLRTHRFALIELAVGLGKSYIISTLASLSKAKRAVILQPAMELVKQNYEKLAETGLDCTMIDSAHKGDWSANYIYTTPQTLCKNLDKLEEPPVVLIDECLTGDTMIQTLDQEKRLDTICIGDIIMCATGPGKVVATSKKYTNKLYKVRLSDGRTIKGTGNHPVFTERGWTRLDNLEIRENIFSIQDMSRLWETIPSNRQQNKRIAVSQQKILQSVLLKERQSTTTHTHRQASNSKQDIEAQQVCKSWREWESSSKSSIRFTKNTWRKLGMRVCNKNWALSGREWLSNLLQGRHWKSSVENCNRNRWTQPSMSCEESNGQKENGFLTTARVESIQIEEQRVSIPVYNLQVSGHPSYFANGVLTHNCHMFWSGKMFNTIFRKWKNCKVVLLTATPYYNVQKTEYSGGYMWSVTKTHSIADELGIEPCVRLDREAGLKLGYGCTIRFHKLPIYMLKAEHIKDQATYQYMIDFHIDEVRKVVKNMENCIIYCDSIAQAELLQAKLGLPCECVFGSTPKKKRIELIDKLKSGVIKYVITVGCLKLGFDFPGLQNILLLANFNNECEAEQIIGRLNRGHGEKDVYYIGRLNNKKPVPGKTTKVRLMAVSDFRRKF